MDGADLNAVVDRQLARLTGVYPVPVDIGSVRAIQVFQRDGAGRLVEVQQRMLPRTPDAIGRLLVFQVDVDRLFIGTADVVLAGIDGELHANLLAAHDDQLRSGARGDAAFDRCGGRRRRGGRGR